jgi:hypothetical protein
MWRCNEPEKEKKQTNRLLRNAFLDVDLRIEVACFSVRAVVGVAGRETGGDAEPGSVESLLRRHASQQVKQNLKQKEGQ